MKKYNGVIVPMVTPVTSDRKLDEESVVIICDYLARNGVSILVLGTTGESPSVSMDESRRLVKLASETVAGRVKIYAGISGNCLEENISNAQAYIKARADVIVSILPCYYPLTPGQMYDYFKTFAERIDFPTMVYNIPATTTMSIPVEVVNALSRIQPICGFKDSERDEVRMEECINLFKDRDNFSYFSGYAALSLKALKLGADGLVPSTANFAPAMFRELYDFSCAGNWEEAERLQEETDEIAQIYQSGRTLGTSLPALKVMMNVLGLCQPYALPPLTDLTTSEQSEIAKKTELIIEKYKIQCGNQSSEFQWAIPQG
jgi:dihydrodipicolinate synthase/N-acetylneuraminate lyase